MTPSRIVRQAAVRALALITASSAFGIGSVQAADITGAGATFPAPVYARWAEGYATKTGNKMNYQSIGSGGGIKQITAKTVDFGASDMPLSPEDLEKGGLMQFPTVIGGVVPVVNLPGVGAGDLKITGPILADVYMGKVVKWNDKEIADLNPKVTLPNQDIAVVRRADGSGTTFIFTNYLSKTSAEWKQKVGEGTAVQWPVGLGGKGNEGVAAFVTRIPASIGYVEFAYAKQNKMAYMTMQNRDGQWVNPTEEAFKSAAAGADWTKSAFAEILTDKPGKATWPISGATFILMHKVQAKPERAADVLKFFSWSYENGAAMATQLDYVPLPDSLISLIHKSWSDIKDANGKPVYTGN